MATTVERQGFPDCVVHKIGGGRQVRDPGDVHGLVISGDCLGEKGRVTKREVDHGDTVAREERDD